LPQYEDAKSKYENYVPNMRAEGYTLVQNYRIGSAGPEFREGTSVMRKFWAGDGTPTDGPDRRTYIDGRYSDATDISVFKDAAASLGNQISEANTRASAVADQFYTKKAEYEDTVNNKLNPTKATYDGHVQNMVRLGEQAVQLSSETEKLGVTLGTAAGEYTVKQNELAIGLATEVAKTAGQDITTQLDTKKAEDAETSRVAQAAEDKRIADAKAIEDDKATQLVEDKKIADAKEAADLAKTQAADAEKAIREKATQEEQTLLAEQQKQEADALAQKQAEDTRLAQEAENTRLAQEAEDTRLAKVAEDERLAQQQKTEDDARLAQLAEEFKYRTELTGPTGFVAGPGTGIVSTPGGTEL
jgi:flagellar biosynthesis GTPase FlhF